jgi:hypothetical protein
LSISPFCCLNPYGIIIVRYETVHDMRSKPLHRKRNFYLGDK